MSLYKMTKQELIVTCRKLQSENDRLEDELDRLSDCYTEMENKWADAVNTLDCAEGIKDVNHFKWILQLEGLLTTQLESAIEDYLKWYNKRRG